MAVAAAATTMGIAGKDSQQACRETARTSQDSPSMVAPWGLSSHPGPTDTAEGPSPQEEVIPEFHQSLQAVSLKGAATQLFSDDFPPRRERSYCEPRDQLPSRHLKSRTGPCRGGSAITPPRSKNHECLVGGFQFLKHVCTEGQKDVDSRMERR